MRHDMHVLRDTTGAQFLVPSSATHKALTTANARGLLVECRCYGLTCVPLPPKSHVWESSSPAPQKVAIIGNRVLTDVIS